MSDVTVICWTNFEDLPQFFVAEGNLTHLDGVVIGVCDDKKKVKELTNLMFGDASQPSPVDEPNTVKVGEPLSLGAACVTALDYRGQRSVYFINCGICP